MDPNKLPKRPKWDSLDDAAAAEGTQIHRFRQKFAFKKPKTRRQRRDDSREERGDIKLTNQKIKRIERGDW